MNAYSPARIDLSFNYFPLIVLWRMNAIHYLENIPRCTVEFDCGCGNGVINACRKVAINSLTLLAL